MAAAPATCGLAIDVPLAEYVASTPLIHAEVIDTPGAKISTQDP